MRFFVTYQKSAVVQSRFFNTRSRLKHQGMASSNRFINVVLCEIFQLSIVSLKMVVLYIGLAFPNSIVAGFVFFFFLNISFIKPC